MLYTPALCYVIWSPCHAYTPAAAVVYFHMFAQSFNKDSQDRFSLSEHELLSAGSVFRSIYNNVIPGCLLVALSLAGWWVLGHVDYIFDYAMAISFGWEKIGVYAGILFVDVVIYAASCVICSVSFPHWQETGLVILGVGVGVAVSVCRSVLDEKDGSNIWLFSPLLGSFVEQYFCFLPAHLPYQCPELFTIFAHLLTLPPSFI